MASKLTPWLSGFVQSEIESVLKWHQDLETYPDIKPDPDTRFKDDGCNFRCKQDWSVNESRRLQLTEVVELKIPATVFVSDGVTRIRARLSEVAVRHLECELDGKLALETKGDIFQVTECTLITTPFGPPDWSIQLFIDEITYDCHLHRVPGGLTQIQEQPDIRKLIAVVTELRQRPYANLKEDDFNQSASQTSGKSRTKVENRSGSLQLHGEVKSSLPTSSPKRLSDINQTGSQRLNENRAKAGSQSKSPETLESVDPQALNESSALSPDTQSVQGGLTSSTNTHTLLNMFQKRSGQPQANPVQSTLKELSTQVINETPLPRSKKPSPYFDSDWEGKHDQWKARKRAKSSPHPDDPTMSSAQLRLSDAEPQHSPANPPVREDSPEPVSQSSDVPIKRRKVSKDQMKLLEHPSSWVPSLPGHELPRPNVPIELLTKWNNAQLSTMQSITRRNESRPTPLERPESPPNSAMDTSESSEEDEEISKSQWPASPEAKRPELPPSSPICGGGGGLTPIRADDDELEMAVPRELPATDSSVRGGNVQSRRPTFPHKQPSQIPSVNSSAPDETSPRTLNSPLQPSPSKPIVPLYAYSLQHKEEEAVVERSEQSVAHSSPSRNSSPKRRTSPVRHSDLLRPPISNLAPNLSRQTGPVRELSPFNPPSIAQRRSSGNAKLDPRRPNSPSDPAERHRALRTAFFLKSKRRDWLRANYVHDPQSEGDFYTTLAAYRDSHPSEEGECSEGAFFEALEVAFPEVVITRLMHFREKQRGDEPAPSTPRRAAVEAVLAHDEAHGTDEKIEQGLEGNGTGRAEAKPVFVEFYETYTALKSHAQSHEAARPSRRVDVLSWDVG